MRNGIDRQSIDRLADRVCAEGVMEPRREEFPGTEVLKLELEQHLDMRYEVKSLKVGVGHDGDIYLTDCFLRPRDEL